MEEQSLRYLKIANDFELQIRDGLLKTGDKLPSLRTICREKHVSLNTASHAYFILECKGMIASRPKTGYFVALSSSYPRNIPVASNPKIAKLSPDIQETFEVVYSNVHNANIVFSAGECSTNLLPVAKLNKELGKATRSLKDSGAHYNRGGNTKLISHAIRRSYEWNKPFNTDDIMVISGSMESISICFQSLLKPGDTVAVESPVWYYVLHLIKHFQLNVVELPTDPVIGIDINYLRQAIKKHNIKLCFVMSNFGNPFGTCASAESKKELVNLMVEHNIPLIEDDIYGDLYFGSERPSCYKSFDKTGIVIYCSSFSKTIAAGYRVAWMAPGKFKDKITNKFPFTSLFCNPLTHEAVGSFLESGKYENHLRGLRQLLYRNSLLFSRAIREYFPEETKITNPEGGMQIWVELDKRIDTIELYNKTMKFNISMCPGRIFSLQRQFNNCLRISFGMEWEQKIEDAIKLIGKLCST